MQQQYWGGAAIALVVAVVSGVAEHRRRGRRNLDAAGFMPWMAIQMLALIGALALASVAMNAR